MRVFQVAQQPHQDLARCGGAQHGDVDARPRAGRAREQRFAVAQVDQAAVERIDEQVSDPPSVATCTRK